MKTDRLLYLRDLLLALFSPPELDMHAFLFVDRTILQEIPQGLPPVLHAFQMARAFDRRGELADRKFWDILVQERPGREEEIRRTETLFVTTRAAGVLLWGDEAGVAPPNERQIAVLHLMAAEAKRPLLWMQTSISDIYSLTRETEHRLKHQLEVALERLNTFTSAPRLTDLVQNYAIIPRLENNGG